MSGAESELHAPVPTYVYVQYTRLRMVDITLTLSICGSYVYTLRLGVGGIDEYSTTYFLKKYCSITIYLLLE